MVLEKLKGFFDPQAIAIVGASQREDSIGTQILRNLLAGYSGKVYPVNPFRKEIQGIQAYPSVNRLPSKVDLAIIATPAHTVPQIIEECGKQAITNVIVVSAGFDACNIEGQTLIKKILEYKKKYGLSIIGPNSLGVIRPNLNLYATFTEKKAAKGKIAFISQSASLCGAALDWSLETHVGLSAVVSMGSTVDVDFGELIDYFGNDPQTRVIMLYVESIGDVRSFMSAARGYAKTKPIVIVKVNRSYADENGLSENSKLKEAIYDASFRRCGLVQVETINDLFDCSKTLLMQAGPSSSQLTILTNAGGPAFMAVEHLRKLGGTLAKLSSATHSALQMALPYYCRQNNPIDLLEEATPQRYSKAIKICLGDDASGSLLVIYTPIGLTKPQALADAVTELASQTRRNILVCLMGEDADCQAAKRTLQRNSIPVFRSPQEAIRTFMNIYTHKQNLQLLYQTPEEVSFNQAMPDRLKAVMRSAFFEGRQALDLTESFQFLEAYGIPTVRTLVALDVDTAKANASEIGYPVLMRAGNEEIEVNSESELKAHFDLLIKQANRACSTEVRAVAIQPKHPNDLQLSLYSHKDPEFGFIIMLGTAGILGKYIGDLTVGFPPLNSVLARELLLSTMRHIPAKSARATLNFGDSMEQLIVRLSELVIDLPEIGSIEVNPIIANDKKVYALNTKITLDSQRIARLGAEHREHLAIAPYPRQYISTRTLKNGVKVSLRPIKPEDENRFNELFKSLSKESVRFRFFQVIQELSHDTLSRFCNLDYDREIAIVAELEDNRRMIGVARVIPDVDRRTGEFAIMVSDAWHGLGLGSKLVDSIVEVACDLRLQSIYSLVDPENVKMLSLSQKKGFNIQPMDEYTVKISLSLTSQN